MIAHAHTYTTKAKAGECCALCEKPFAPGERIRDRRSTINPSGMLMCWNGTSCAERGTVMQMRHDNDTPHGPLVSYTFNGENLAAALAAARHHT